MRKILIILICLFASKSSFACINEYRTLLSGEVVYTAEPSRGKVWNKKIDTVKLRNKANELLIAYERSDSLEYYSDYAAALIYLGDYPKAKKIYEQIETSSPNLYTTASNLGTIYELIGKPDSALIWINKSIKLNPNSHKGSEWIHIKILEFKISETQEIDESILGLNFGNGKIPTNPDSSNLGELEEHIWHQLRERTTFVKPKNEIVGNIYFDLGNVLSQTSYIQAALESYEAAKEYGFESELMNRRVEEFEKLALKAKSKQSKKDLKDFILPFFGLLLSVGLPTFIIAILLFFYYRK